MRVTLGEIGTTYGGLTGKSGRDFGSGEARFLPFVEVLADARIRGRRLDPVVVRRGENQNQIQRGDLIFNGTSETREDIAMAAVVDFDVHPRTYLNSFCFGLRLARRAPVDPTYIAYFFRSSRGRELVASLAQGFTRFNISKTRLLETPLELPDLGEQKAVVVALSEVDDLIAVLERAIEKRSSMRYGTMQALLTGETRLPGFSEPWRTLRMRDVLRPRKEVNSEGRELEVLSCTKHLGFVRSLDYFRNQVFSRDLRGYRVIYRGDIGYPSNHVEEGSIGVQDLFDQGLVSPIYVVMRPIEGNNPFFLHRLMKLDSFRQRFAQATSASVDRRGSLRWPEFAEIQIDVPAASEQNAIVEVIRDMEEEIKVLGRRLTSVRAIKKGMMQELFSGQTRLVTEGASA